MSRSRVLKGEERKKAKGFAFVVEVLIAIILFAGFVQMSSLSSADRDSFAEKINSKQTLNSALTFLDQNGSLLELLDSNQTSEQKMSGINSSLSSILKGHSIRAQITAFEADINKCRASPDFNSCFAELPLFAPSGPDLPTDKDITHERLFIFKKAQVQQCTLGATFSPFKNTGQIIPGSAGLGGSSPASRIFFSEKGAMLEGAKEPKIFFAGESDRNDLNVSFSVSVSPLSEAQCDQNIRVDLNVSITAPGRFPADIMLVQDRSGSMSWDGSLSLTDPRDIFILGQYAFVADGSAGLRDINIQSPLNPSIVGTYNTPGTASGVYVSGNTAYVADGSSGLSVINVTNKTSPASLGSITGIGTASRVFAQGNYAYVITTSGGAADFIDINVWGAPNVDLNIGKNAPQSFAAQSFVPASNTIRTVGLMLKKTGNPTKDLDVHLRSTIQGADLASATIARGDITTSYALYKATFASDISVNPAQTYYIVLTTSTLSGTKYFSWGARNTNPYANGGAYEETAALANTDAFFQTYHRARMGLQVIDVSTPASPKYISSVPGSDPADIFVSGSYAYFSDGTSGLKIVDLTSATNPAVVGTLATTNAAGIIVSGNTAYLADGSAGLRIIDVAVKTNPAIISTYNTPGTAYSVFPYSDGNTYVADDTSLQAINTLVPASPVLAASYANPYNAYQRLQIAQDTAFLLPGYNNSLTTFNIYNGPKINQSKSSAAAFIDNNGWKALDKMGLVSFASTVATDQTLLLLTDANRQTLKTKINSLVANGGTAMGDAILAATAELTSARTRPDEYKFQVLLTDGQSNTGSNPLTAASDANSKGIKVYTIGFGNDADEATLTQIASITGGTYYRANDINALQAIYSLIAQDIGEFLSQASSKAYDSNITIPIDQCSFAVDLNGGVCQKINDSNYIIFNISYIDQHTPWAGHYQLNIPCNNPAACAITSLTIPGPGTMFYWEDSNHTSRDPFTWDTNKTISFKYADLSVKITSATISENNEVFLDVNSMNLGLLGTPQTTLDFYLDDPVTGTQLKQEAVKALSPDQFQLFLGEQFTSQGWLYAIINKSGAVPECPGNNIASVHCVGGPKTQYYILDVWAWAD